jgi:hypothetical protein
MKKMLYKAMALMLSMAMCVSLSSCGDDDDDDDSPIVDTTTIVSVVANYSVTLSDDYFNLWDVQVTYSTASGTQTETITSAWSKTETFTDANALPSQVAFSVVGKPKATIPTLEDDKVYSLAAAYAASVSGVQLSGQTVILDKASNSSTLSAKGNNAKLLEYLNNGRTVCDVTLSCNY